MALEINHDHTCNNCGDNPRKDECYCEKCYNKNAEISYDDGIKAGKELAKDNE